MDVDDMFDLMKTITGAKSTVNNETTIKEIVTEPVQEPKKHFNMSTPEEDEKGVKPKILTKRDGLQNKLITNQLKPEVMNLISLQKLCSEDISQAIFTLVDRKSGFLDIFHEKNLKTEQIFCVMHLLGKLCHSESLRCNETVLSPACSPEFLQVLLDCIGTLPIENNVEIKKQIGKFFEDVFTFVNTVSIVFPMTASHRMRKILLSTQILQEHLPGVSVSEHVSFEIKSLYDQLESQNVSYNNINPVSADRSSVINVKPPNNFRCISVYPTKDDLFSKMSFLRENIVVGAYADVDHYLDVQFRLYKEDFVAPLREGLEEYLKNSTNLDQGKRINNVRCYSNVRFLGSEIKGDNMGCTVQFSKVKFKKIVWSTSKRLMFGSLLIFSNDNFKSFFLATVSDRDFIKLEQSLVTVKLIGNTPPDLFLEEFIMLESEVFFEPYFQVLTVLKEIYKYSFPMEDYIIHVKAEQSVPGENASISKNTQYSYVKYLSITENLIRLYALDNSEPNHKNSSLDSSQNKAVKAALANAFSVIQGPPGTGKTYIGLIIANTLLSERGIYEPPLLVICYTNHALDQFLEGILPHTSKLVRLGGQSKSKNLKRFHITEIRRKEAEKQREQCSSKRGRKDYYCSSYASYKRSYYEAKEVLEGKKIQLLTLENEIKTLQTSILSIGFFKQHFNHKQQRMLSDRVLVDWLMEECVNSEVLDYNDIEKEMLSSGTETEEENSIDLDKLDGAEDEYSSGIDIKEEEEVGSEFENLFDDNYSQFLEPNKVFEDLELASHYERRKLNTRQTLLNKMREIKFKEDYKKIIDKANDKFVDLNFENELNNIDSLIAILSQLRTKFYKISEHNKKWKHIYCLRYEIIHELKLQKKYLDDNEIDKLECLNFEVCNECIEDELEQLLESIKKKMIIEINAKKKYLKKKLFSKPVFNSDIVENFKNCSDIWVISTDDRWMLYHYWTNLYRQNLMNYWNGIRLDYDTSYRHLKTIGQDLDKELLRSMDVIGLTTTCGARLRRMLEALSPKIVIIEEAAEVFEAHIVATLTKSCEKVVLIGDHEQLRPSPSTYKLAKKYNLDISLFERMIRNGMCCYSLETQHRMRPEIVSLIVPAIYKKLDNHQSVLNRPDIRGIASNIYFVTHNLHEMKVKDSMSRRNTHEADFLIALCTYLLSQGYSPDKITILTTYIGQMYYLKEVVKKQVSTALHSVRITVVDNYQGEENDIILLSLVRSNKEARVGFLATKNRICVALSRARDGLYIIGNMDNLTERSTVWQEVKEQLQKQNAIGPALPLRCTVHSHNITRVSFAADFRNMHNSGCTLPCGTELNCGHVCPELCHLTNREHVYDPNSKSSIRCNEIVTQILLCGHERTLPCYQTTDDTYECDDEHKCDVKVEYNLDCGHTVMLPWQDNISKYKCKELVEVTLRCGHPAMLSCYQDPERYKCMEIVLYEFELCGHTVNKCCWVPKVDPWLCNNLCGMELPCGHDCEKVCHQYNNPHYHQVKCMKECTRRRNGCSLDHECRKLCYENCEPCNENVQKNLPCGHVADLKCKDDITKFFCEEYCEKILPCNHTDTISCGTDVEKYFCHTILCTKVLPCGHEMELFCGEDKDVTKVKCMKPCSRTLKCEHKCQLLCYEPCICYVMVTNNLPGCDHEMTLPCHKVTKNMICKERCTRVLSCEHPCRVLCGYSCDLVKCQEPCSRLLKCGHPCTEKCGESCDLVKCQELCSKLLKCGHSYTGKCQDFGDIVKCQEPCLRFLKCGHTCTGECGESCDFIKCQEPCSELLKCGHPCTAKCEKSCDFVKCQEPCKKILECGHPCTGKCGESCDLVKCQEPCSELLECGHPCTAKCEKSCDLVKCQEPCTKILECGHPCTGKCGESCDLVKCQEPCSELLKCGHPCTAKCEKFCDLVKCQEPCTKILECGHPCTGKCGEPCHLVQCEETIVKEAKTDCGHENVLIRCSTHTYFSAKPSPYLMMYFCNEPCTAELPCGHKCVGSCGRCMQGSVHIPCVQKCTNKLVCGHECKELCKELCPPCNQPCLYSCQHGSCQKKCGEPCHPCQEKCDWSCPHAKCTKLCFEMCNKDPCNKPCPLNLMCGHPCMGFCGEVCPTLCRVCDNLDYSVDDRLVLLEDCGHAIQSSCLDEMFQFSEENSDIVVRTCPVCDCIISTTKRYRNAVRTTSTIVRHIKNNVISNLRRMNSWAGTTKIRKDLRHIYDNKKPFMTTAAGFLGYLLNIYKGEERVQVTRKKYAATFLSNLIIELSKEFVKFYRITHVSLHKDLVGASLRSNPNEICHYKYILLRAQLLLQKMELRLMGMSIHDMQQFYLEVLRLKIILYRIEHNKNVNDKSCFLWETYSLEMAEKEKSRLQDLMSDLNLSVNVWALCPSGHILLKSNLYPARLNNEKDGLKYKCSMCDSENEKLSIFLR